MPILICFAFSACLDVVAPMMVSKCKNFTSRADSSDFASASSDSAAAVNLMLGAERNTSFLAGTHASPAGLTIAPVFGSRRWKHIPYSSGMSVVFEKETVGGTSTRRTLSADTAPAGMCG